MRKEGHLKGWPGDGKPQLPEDTDAEKDYGGTPEKEYPHNLFGSRVIMVQVKDVLKWIDARAPFRYAESWDNCGLQVGDPEASVKRVLVALDPSSQSFQEAENLGCQCLVTHHPLLFRPLSAVRMDRFPGNLVIRALQKGIHVISAHTNLDSAREGTNEQWVRLLSLRSVVPLESQSSWSEEPTYGGMGRVGNLPGPVSLKTFAEQIRNALGGIPIRVVGDQGTQIRRVALCTGSGGSFIEKVISEGVEAYVTGDVKYHEAQRAVESGLNVIDVGHFASERLVVGPLADYLKLQADREGTPVEVLTAFAESDPFWILQ